MVDGTMFDVTMVDDTTVDGTMVMVQSLGSSSDEELNTYLGATAVKHPVCSPYRKRTSWPYPNCNTLIAIPFKPYESVLTCIWACWSRATSTYRPTAVN